MDRFTLESPADLQANFRRSMEYEGPECECRFTGDVADASVCDLHGSDAGDLHAEPIPDCETRRLIVDAAETVGELLDGLRAHRMECSICGDGPAWAERRAA